MSFLSCLPLVLIGCFFILRGLKRLAQRMNRHCDSGGGDTPDGYQALPGDAAVPASRRQGKGADRAGGGSDHVDVDDAVVVTGTPVNPPPSVRV